MLLTKDEAINYIKEWTNLEEVSPWKFLISPETEMMWEIVPAKYLEIN